MLILEDDGIPARLQNASWYHWDAAKSSGMSHLELGYMASSNPRNERIKSN